MVMQGWGKHMVVDAKGCQLDRARDPEYISHFIKELVRQIEMVPFGEPQVVHFADNTEKAGFTAIQLIETSNIMAHFLDHNGDLYLDVFSCKDFENQRVTDCLQSFFSPEKIYYNIITRDARR
jgi:S-adenosylmethionine/arginine decarboxylase-like enzyme